MELKTIKLDSKLIGKCDFRIVVNHMVKERLREMGGDTE